MIDTQTAIDDGAEIQAEPRHAPCFVTVINVGHTPKHPAQHPHDNDLVAEHDRYAPHQRIKLGTADGEGVERKGEVEEVKGVGHAVVTGVIVTAAKSPPPPLA